MPESNDLFPEPPKRLASLNVRNAFKFIGRGLIIAGLTLSPMRTPKPKSVTRNPSILARKFVHIPGAEEQVLRLRRVLFNEFAARFDFVTHQDKSEVLHAS